MFEVVDLLICIKYIIFNEYIFIIYYLYFYCFKKKKVVLVCSELVFLNLVVLGEFVKSGRELSLEGGGVGIK